MTAADLNGAKPKHPQRLARTGYLALFLGPAAIYALVFLLLPYMNVLRYSFWSVDNYAVLEQFTFVNYERILTNALYRTAIANSLVVAVVVTITSVCLGFALAFYVAFFAGRARSALFFMIVIPLWTSFLLRAFIWRIILGREGVLNGFLVSTGIVDEPLDMLLFNRFSVCLALTYVFIPFVALPVYAAMENIPKELVEASMDLGGGAFTTLRRVIFPMSLPGIVTGAVFTFCLSFGDFVAPSLLGGPSNLMVAGVIVNQFGSAFDWPMGSALAIVLIVVVGAGVMLASSMERRDA